jgi:ATP-dependent DNA helicase RecQ
MSEQQKVETLLNPQQSAKDVLKQVFGYDNFRIGQDVVIEAAMQGQDTLVLMPTGGGKSLCYQIPALLMPGLTIVISPLISLMQDQVAQLKAVGVAAAYINQSQTYEEQQQIFQQLYKAEIKLLYVAPERILQSAFLERIRHLDISLFAIDEAHCVSHWGHDFRPHYCRLQQLKQYFQNIPMMALTATADTATRQDIVIQLGLTSPHIHTGSFDRPNIRYTLEEKFKPLSQLLRYLRQQKGQSGIIYCTSLKRVDDIAA